MACVRGSVLLNSTDFVRERYGSASHLRVLESLPPQGAEAFARGGRDAWIPLEVLLAYMEGAKRLLAPGDPDFFRKMGFYGGRQDRTRPLSVMVSDRATAIRKANDLWRAFFDAGALEVVETGPAGVTLRIAGFPASAPLCERIVGSLEGLLSLAGQPIRVEKRACRARGQPCCEVHVEWTHSWSRRSRRPLSPRPRPALGGET
jgi:hypothetical protein